jgi:predicted phosphate transport protein (TIGR00153 family)
MRFQFFAPSGTLPFDGFQEHATKVKECAWAFQQAMECYFSDRCDRFEEYLGEIDRLESEADEIKSTVRGAISKRGKLPVEKFQLFLYIQEQDKVLDCVEDCLNWIYYRPYTVVSDELRKGIFDLVDAVITPIEELSVMVIEARKLFSNFSEKQRDVVKGLVRSLHMCEHEADKMEDSLKLNIFTKESDPIVVLHMIGVVERIGAIANHAENTGDVMRAMIESY